MASSTRKIARNDLVAIETPDCPSLTLEPLMSEAAEPRHQWTAELIAFHQAIERLLTALQSTGLTRLSSEDYVHDILVNRLRDGEWAQHIDRSGPERLMGFDAYADRLYDHIASQENNA
jgi:hypothetical protein